MATINIQRMSRAWQKSSTDPYRGSDDAFVRVTLVSQRTWHRSAKLASGDTWRVSGSLGYDAFEQ